MTLERSKHDVSVIRRASAFMAAIVIFDLSVHAAFAAVPAGITLETAKPGELAAMQVRVLQSEMMVAALQCELRPQYNEIVVVFQDELGRHGNALRTYFERSFGRAAGEKKLNSFVTEMANRASSHAVSQGSFYCNGARNLMAEMVSLKAKGRTLADASRDLVDMTSFQVVTPGGVQVATVAKPEVVIAAAHPSRAKAVEQADVATTKAAKKAAEALAAAEAANAEAKAAEEEAALNAGPGFLWLLSQHAAAGATPSLLSVPAKPVDEVAAAIEDISALPTPTLEDPLVHTALTMKAAQAALPQSHNDMFVIRAIIGAAFVILISALGALVFRPIWRRRREARI